MEHPQYNLCEYRQELDHVETSVDCSLAVDGDLPSSSCFASHDELQLKQQQRWRQLLALFQMQAPVFAPCSLWAQWHWDKGNCNCNVNGKGARGMGLQGYRATAMAQGQGQWQSIVPIAMPKGQRSINHVGRGRQHDRVLFRAFYSKKLVNAKKRWE
jgi:hypothetical protein